jgi:hypothetical protein
MDPLMGSAMAIKGFIDLIKAIKLALNGVGKVSQFK